MLLIKWGFWVTTIISYYLCKNYQLYNSNKNNNEYGNFSFIKQWEKQRRFQKHIQAFVSFQRESLMISFLKRSKSSWMLSRMTHGTSRFSSRRKCIAHDTWCWFLFFIFFAWSWMSLPGYEHQHLSCTSIR